MARGWKFMILVLWVLAHPPINSVRNILRKKKKMEEKN